MGCQKWLRLCAPIFLTYFGRSLQFEEKILPVVVAAVVVAVVAANFYRLSSSGALQPDQGGVQDLELILEICLDVQLLDDVL